MTPATRKRDRTALLAMRKARRDTGLCPQCGDHAHGYATCQRCRQQRADRVANRARASVRQSEWRRSYRKYRKTHLARKVELQVERHAAGLCVKCGLQPCGKFKRCLECRVKCAERHAARRAK